jgi:hypothetical protein
LPIILNFVFEPSEYGKEELKGDQQKQKKEGKKAEKQTKKSKPEDSQPETDNLVATKPDIEVHDPAKTLKAEPLKNNEGDLNPITNPNRIDVPDKQQTNRSNPKEEYSLLKKEYSPVHPFKSGLTNKYRRPSIHPKLIPASLPLTQRQQNTITKHVKKFVNKVQKIGFADSIFIWQDKKQNYRLKINHKPSGTTGLDELVVEISTLDNQHTFSTELRMKRLAFSNFAHFVDFWDPWVMVHDDEINGRFHTNTEFAISIERDVKPKFHGKVTTAGYKVKSGGTFPILDHKSIFPNGIELGSQEIKLPKTSSPLHYDSSIDSQQIHYLTEETWITFNRNGSYYWRTSSSNGLKNQHEEETKSVYIMGNKKAKIHLKGTVKGKFLVFSEADIFIDDDVVYSQHPELSFKANDYLGIVSQKNIKISHPSITGPGDLHIHAAIYTKNRFSIPNRRRNGKATLHIYGSLCAGSLSATEPRYATHVVFDKRLETRRPPNFPMTDQYEIFEWNKLWIIKNP